jgi:hypothetical protein
MQQLDALGIRKSHPCMRERERVASRLRRGRAPVRTFGAGFSGDTIGGQALMDQSGINFQTQTYSFGKAACAIDNEPAQFTQCLPQNAPYWALFVETSGAWATAQTGYTDVTLHDKDAIGWHYVQAADASPAPPPLANES